jgi:predicted nucleic acid-binding protein
VVLVDTSVWIRFLAGMEPYASGLDQLLSADEVLGHDFVYGELLIGDRGGRPAMLATYAGIHRAPVVPHADVVEFVSRRHLAGRGLGWIDAHLLASALVSQAALWTADRRLATVAGELGIASRSS